mmetsp:Transcript_9651/g.29294  ORF Transcript_9651/g.29294 Transcript_9651/m.29294 type:complete len:234 (-) Transcript_9651:527-1228(-)
MQSLLRWLQYLATLSIFTICALLSSDDIKCRPDVLSLLILSSHLPSGVAELPAELHEESVVVRNCMRVQNADALAQVLLDISPLKLNLVRCRESATVRLLVSGGKIVAQPGVVAVHLSIQVVRNCLLFPFLHMYLCNLPLPRTFKRLAEPVIRFLRLVEPGMVGVLDFWRCLPLVWNLRKPSRQLLFCGPLAKDGVLREHASIPVGSEHAAGPAKVPARVIVAGKDHLKVCAR